MSTSSAALVTGLGLVTPLGASVADTMAALSRGIPESAEVARTRAGTSIRTAAAQRERVQVALPTVKLEKYLGWPSQLALRAATEATTQAGLSGGATNTGIAPERIGVYVAVGTSGLDCVEFFAACSAAWLGEAPGDFGQVGGRPLRLIDPHFALRTLANGPAAFVAMQGGARGPSMVFAQSACAGVSALQCAIDDLALDRCDLAIVAGCDSLLFPTRVIVRERAGVLDRSPAPVLSEGAAAIVLEREARPSARALGRILCAETFRPAAGRPPDAPAWRECADAFGGAVVPPRVWDAAADGAEELLAQAVAALSLERLATRQPIAPGDLGAASALAWTVVALAEREPASAAIVVAEPTGQAGVVCVSCQL